MNRYKEISLADVSLIIATYNEEESLSFVLQEIENYGLGEIIIIDANSEDRTREIANKFNTTFITETEKGWGNAVLKAINYSSKKYITYIDADGSYNPIAIKEMRKLIEEYDAVFCSRYKNGAKSPDDTVIRAFGNKLFTLLVRIIFKCKITDALFFYPMFNRKILQDINLKSPDFTLCLELPAVVHEKNFRYIEILSEERKRYAGVSKVNALTDGVKILIGIFKLRFSKWDYI